MPETRTRPWLVLAAILPLAGAALAAWLMLGDEPRPEPLIAAAEPRSRAGVEHRAAQADANDSAEQRAEKLARALRTIEEAARINVGRPGDSTSAGQAPDGPIPPLQGEEEPDADAERDADTMPRTETERRFELPPPFPVDRDGIKAAIQSATPQIKECYDGWLEYHPRLAGKLVIAFTIGSPEGERKLARITDVELVENRVRHGVMEGCVLNVVSNLRFQRPDGGGEVTVRYPMFFSSKDDDEE